VAYVPNEPSKDVTVAEAERFVHEARLDLERVRVAVKLAKEDVAAAELHWQRPRQI